MAETAASPSVGRLSAAAAAAASRGDGGRGDAYGFAGGGGGGGGGTVRAGESGDGDLETGRGEIGRRVAGAVGPVATQTSDSAVTTAHPALAAAVAAAAASSYRPQVGLIGNGDGGDGASAAVAEAIATAVAETVASAAAAAAATRVAAAGSPVWGRTAATAASVAAAARAYGGYLPSARVRAGPSAATEALHTAAAAAGLGGAIFGHAADIRSTTARSSTTTPTAATQAAGRQRRPWRGRRDLHRRRHADIVHSTISGNQPAKSTRRGSGIGGGGIVVYQPTETGHARSRSATRSSPATAPITSATCGTRRQRGRRRQPDRHSTAPSVRFRRTRRAGNRQLDGSRHSALVRVTRPVRHRRMAIGTAARRPTLP